MAGEGVVGHAGHGGLAVHHVVEGVEVGLLEGVLVLSALLGGGRVGREEERGALHPDMTPLRLADGGVRPSGAGQDDIIHVVGVQPDLQDRHLGVVVQRPCSQSVRAQGCLSVFLRPRCKVCRRAKGAFCIRKNGVKEAFAMPWDRVGQNYACYTRTRNAPGSNPTH